jgi:hypothetical protein
MADMYVLYTRRPKVANVCLIPAQLDSTSSDRSLSPVQSESSVDGSYSSSSGQSSVTTPSGSLGDISSSDWSLPLAKFDNAQAGLSYLEQVGCIVRGAQKFDFAHGGFVCTQPVQLRRSSESSSTTHYTGVGIDRNKKLAKAECASDIIQQLCKYSQSQRCAC